MEYLFIYLLQLANVIENLVFVIVTISIILLIVSIISIGSDENKSIFKAFIISVILAFIVSLTPTKNTVAMMGGVYLAKKASRAITLDVKMNKLDKIINLQLDKYIKELQQQN